MYNNIELLSLKCASCGASLENFQGQTEIQCDFCQNVTKILRPIKVNANTQKLSLDVTEKFNNLVAIMEKSMVAGNYKEAYQYCNKALELDPENASLWEDKAIASFWMRSDSEIINTEANEILTYLNAAKQINPDSPTYNSTAISLSSNLYFAVYFRYFKMVADEIINAKTGQKAYSNKSISQLITYLSLMDTCFNIWPTPLFLETAVKELSNLGKLHWIKVSSKVSTNLDFQTQLGFDALKTREKYINKIKKINHDYVPPEIKKIEIIGCFVATAVFGDYDHPVVIDLRQFRDDWLLKRKWGVRFTNWYYTQGPKAVRVIKKSSVLKKVAFLLIIKPLHFIANKLK